MVKLMGVPRLMWLTVVEEPRDEMVFVVVRKWEHELVLPLSFLGLFRKKDTWSLLREKSPFFHMVCLVM